MANTTKVCKRCGIEQAITKFGWVDRKHIYTRNNCRSCCAKRIGKGVNHKLDPIKSPTTLDIAWAAGIWEGEGSCCPVNGQWFRVSVAQKDPFILLKLRDMFGGSVNKYNNDTGYSKPTHIHTWYLYGARAHGFAQTIFTFLSPRRRAQIRGAIQEAYGC